MSRIWAPLPQPEPIDRPPIPAGACWWRRLLTANADGHHLIVHTYPDRGGDEPRLGCWEWFDGLDVQLVFGHDVIDVRFEGRGRNVYLDVLALPAPFLRGWANLTAPDDEDQRHPGWSGLSMSHASLPALPYAYAPKITDESSVHVLPL
ncbi:hypothetical protein Jolie2_55 [Mycobacterium phage Jolie2]|uniref:Uncharacterized protein n=1 Tax=Mycobacterium phage Jolie2 TaxID=1458831 RepID=W8EI16_9CAUD|nr:hypothetical protein Jolie2_55 [Mycobacterium phage Jolie2]AHJ86605.1 hypothetical protein Jolie2_55 [Mycobacterium phage Jolie2]